MSVDYKNTINLPQTDFPMRAGLPELEPKILKRWDDIDLWGKLRADSKGREKFILHDGPPYANGHLHIGHALNKILKDIIVRSRQMTGYDAPYVPGWDCHGLPIEWKIEEKYRAEGLDKDDVPVDEFRKECREFAAKWIDIQRAEFKRLGVLGDWDNPYTTMAYGAEAQIAKEIGKFLMQGSLYKGARPVWWSAVEKTALAEAEAEYMEHKSTTIWVKFPVVTPATPELDGASVVIWTTTPWTIPGNRAIACHEDFDYVVIEVTAVDDGAKGAVVGEKLAVAKALVDSVCEQAKITGHKVVAALNGSQIKGTVCAHPWRDYADAKGGYDFDVPVLAADYVTEDAGTGFVHIAPGHGADDWKLGVEHGIEVPQTVGEDGSFYDFVPLMAGKVVITQDGKEGDANPSVLRELAIAGKLLAKGSIRHQYPHSWRSKAPLIFRNTAQWFISMESHGLRDVALKAIDETAFYPKQGKTRLHSMIKERPDWCISRQRSWGVPIPVFVNKESGEPLRDQAVVDRIVEAFKLEGADAWFSSDPSRFLGNEYNVDDFEQVKDVVDVWFDSGSTHSFVLEGREDQQWPASLYLEGSDQHRGWFHSSLLESCGTRGRAPYDAVLTHGFVMAEDGRKMSKSLGNVVVPAEVNEKYGAEILRLWVVSEDYSGDLRVGEKMLKQLTDYYRRFRNTLRWMLGGLAYYDPAKRVAAADMPELERWVLHRVAELDKIVRKGIENYDFTLIFRELHEFCAVDLSAFYFDIRKDSLYCDAKDDPTRLASLTVLDILFESLTAWLAPILSFTTEEAWLTRHGDADGKSVHLRQIESVPADWLLPAADAARFDLVRQVRRVVLAALEQKRYEKEIRSNLEAAPVLYADAKYVQAFDKLDLADVLITSQARFADGAAPDGAYTLSDVPGVAVVFQKADGEKCERCWKVLPDVGSVPEAPGVCGRCADAVGTAEAAE
ncbi:isoleucine--tRNA ligase [Rhodospirillaceae bacterium KN72]|uniref:Isoleucine--tRNA ligase n=1 Tax=Pacificispira spongiicola TaxID=2729598 RepID=A0A7Y0DZP5_9PROT|nr:isoleucine--tRNA ligase [Pacificispira spongiicola]NMM44550.1 isoleucine--tRNA ligase [Pacificispira spongiicola]